MRLRGSTGGVLCVCAIILSIHCVSPTSARAQANCWTNPFSGYWDEFRNWSLQLRPTNSQSIFITNAPTKIVIIDSYTSGTYPESLTVSNVTVSASAGVTNTLFLSNAGTTTPLSIQDTLAVLGGGVLLMTNSSVQVGGVNGGGFVLEGMAALSGTNSFSGGLYVGLSSNTVGSAAMSDGRAG